MPSTPCIIPTCWKSSKSRHRFPNPEKHKIFFDKWVILCGNKRLLSQTPANTYKTCRICCLHFLPEDFGPNNKLKSGVLPSLCLPDPLETLKDICQASRSKATLIESDCAVPSTSQQAFGSTALEDPPSHSEVDSINVGTQVEATTSTAEQSTSVSLPKTPKRRSTLLSEVNVGQAKDLTPKAKHLYHRAIQFRRKALKSKRSKLPLRKRLRASEKMTSSEMFEKVVSSMDRIRARFFQSQLENVNKRPKGRRYTTEDKVLALALHKQSGAGYRWLSTIFTLPSRKTVMKLLNRIPICPGIHHEVFSVLKAEARNFKNPLDKHCILMFDEISIQPNLQPNIHKGCVEGFEDYGFKQTQEIANHAQVFMLRGIRRKWKQPVYYSFVSGGTKSTDLVHIIKLIVQKCHSIGLNIVATVCDQGSNNQAAINALVKTTREQYKRSGTDTYDFHFEVDGQKIIPLFDVPHLFKGLRNNLVKYNLRFMYEGKEKVAKWDDIYTAYKMDPHIGSLRMMPKLTDAHVDPVKINKMKVSKCTQVLSHSVAVAINVLAYSGTTVDTGEEILTLEKRAEDTAILLDFLDKLFDSLNGSSFQPPPGKDIRTAVTRGSLHVNFWNEALQSLRSFKYIKNGAFFAPPSLKNLISTIKNFKDLRESLAVLGFNYLMPRTFNQDPLENFFGKIRQRGIRNINPRATDFTNYYKSLLVNQLTSAQSVGANCEEDESSLFLTLQRLVTQGFPEEDEDDVQEVVYCQVPENLSAHLKPIESKVLRYVSGYVVKKIGRQPCKCKNSFLKKQEESPELDEDFLHFKEYERGSKHLQYVNDSFLLKMKKALAIIKFIFNRDLYKRGITDYTFKILCERISFTKCFHGEAIRRQIFKYFIRVNLFNYCNQINRIIKGLDQRPVSQAAPKFFLRAKKLHENTVKRRRAQNKNRFANV